MNDNIDMDIISHGNVAIVAFAATSISNSEKIAAASERIKDFIDDNHPHAVVFDFSEVKFFSSQVLGLLLEIRSQLKISNGQVAISAIDPQLYRVFKITNLNTIFKFFPDSDTAVKAVTGN